MCVTKHKCSIAFSVVLKLTFPLREETIVFIFKTNLKPGPPKHDAEILLFRPQCQLQKQMKLLWFFMACREFTKPCSLLTNSEIPVKFSTNTVLHFSQDLKISDPAWVLRNKSLLRVKNKFISSNLHFIFENLSDQS